MSAWTVYLFTRLDALHGTFVAIITISAVVLIMATIFRCLGMPEHNPTSKEAKTLTQRCNKAIIISTISFFFGGMLLMIIPTSKDFAAIYLIPKIVNNEKVEGLPDKALDLMNKKLDEWLLNEKIN